MIHQLWSQDPAAPALRSLLLILRTPSPGASRQLHLQSRSRVPSLLSISRTTAGSGACRLPPGRPHRLRTALCPPTLSPGVVRCDLHKRKTVCSSWAWGSPGSPTYSSEQNPNTRNPALQSLASSEPQITSSAALLPFPPTQARQFSCCSWGQALTLGPLRCSFGLQWASL